MASLHTLTSTVALATQSTTTTSGSGSSSGLALPPEFIALGIGAIVIMTVVWFYLKKTKSGGGSD